MSWQATYCSARELLLEAAKVIEDPDKWCKHAMAKNDAGENLAETLLTPRSTSEFLVRNKGIPGACKWCATGAVYEAIGRTGLIGVSAYCKARTVLDESAKLFTGRTIIPANDCRTTGHRTIMRIFRYSVNKLDNALKG